MDATQKIEYDDEDFEEDDNVNIQYGILRIKKGDIPDGDPREFEIFGGETKIGRDPDLCKIVINNKTLSRLHAIIQIEDANSMTIYDNHSLNKTLRNEKQLKPDTYYEIRGGETITVGEVEMHFQLIEPKRCDVKKATAEDDANGSSLLENGDKKNNDDSDLVPATPFRALPAESSIRSNGAEKILDAKEEVEDDSFVAPSQPSAKASNSKGASNICKAAGQKDKTKNVFEAETQALDETNETNVFETEQKLVEGASFSEGKLNDHVIKLTDASKNREDKKEDNFPSNLRQTTENYSYVNKGAKMKAKPTMVDDDDDLFFAATQAAVSDNAVLTKNESDKTEQKIVQDSDSEHDEVGSNVSENLLDDGLEEDYNHPRQSCPMSPAKSDTDDHENVEDTEQAEVPTQLIPDAKSLGDISAAIADGNQASDEHDEAHDETAETRILDVSSEGSGLEDSDRDKGIESDEEIAESQASGADKTNFIAWPMELTKVDSGNTIDVHQSFIEEQAVELPKASTSSVRKDDEQLLQKNREAVEDSNKCVAFKKRIVRRAKEGADTNDADMIHDHRQDDPDGSADKATESSSSGTERVSSSAVETNDEPLELPSTQCIVEEMKKSQEGQDEEFEESESLQLPADQPADDSSSSDEYKLVIDEGGAKKPKRTSRNQPPPASKANRSRGRPPDNWEFIVQFSNTAPKEQEPISSSTPKPACANHHAAQSSLGTLEATKDSDGQLRRSSRHIKRSCRLVEEYDPSTPTKSRRKSSPRLSPQKKQKDAEETKGETSGGEKSKMQIPHMMDSEFEGKITAQQPPGDTSLAVTDAITGSSATSMSVADSIIAASSMHTNDDETVPHANTESVTTQMADDESLANLMKQSTSKRRLNVSAEDKSKSRRKAPKLSIAANNELQKTPETTALLKPSMNATSMEAVDVAQDVKKPNAKSSSKTRARSSKRVAAQTQNPASSLPPDVSSALNEKQTVPVPEVNLEMSAHEPEPRTLRASKSPEKGKNLLAAATKKTSRRPVASRASVPMSINQLLLSQVPLEPDAKKTAIECVGATDPAAAGGRRPSARGAKSKRTAHPEKAADTANSESNTAAAKEPDVQSDVGPKQDAAQLNIKVEPSIVVDVEPPKRGGGRSRNQRDSAPKPAPQQQKLPDDNTVMARRGTRRSTPLPTLTNIKVEEEMPKLVEPPVRKQAKRTAVPANVKNPVLTPNVEASKMKASTSPKKGRSSKKDVIEKSDKSINLAAAFDISERRDSTASRDGSVGSTSSSSARRRSKPVVMFSKGCDEVQNQKLVKDLGGLITSGIEDCTVFVAERIRRTAKFLCMVSRGIPIVTPVWLQLSKDTKSFQDPWLHIIDDEESQRKWGFNLRTTLKNASKSPILAGKKIHITKSVVPPPLEMKEIVEAAGGTWLKAMPKKHAEDTFVISCEEDRKLVASAIKNAIPLYDKELLLTGLLRRELDYKTNLLHL